MKKFLFLVAFAMSMAGCGLSEKQEIDVLVQGNIDSIYKGIITASYLDVIDEKKESVQRDYEEGIEAEADYLAYYWEMYDEDLGQSFFDLSLETREDIKKFCREMCAKTKYTVYPCVPQPDGNYIATVVVEPLDIMQQADILFYSDTYEPLNAFFEKYEDGYYEDLTEEERKKYDEEYASVIMEMLWELLPEAGYMDAKKQVVQIDLESDNRYSIYQDDWDRICETLIYYP